MTTEKNESTPSRKTVTNDHADERLQKMRKNLICAVQSLCLTSVLSSANNFFHGNAFDIHCNVASLKLNISSGCHQRQHCFLLYTNHLEILIFHA